MAAAGFYQKKREEQRRQQAIWDAETAASFKRSEEMSKRIAERDGVYKQNLAKHTESRKNKSGLVPGALGGIFDSDNRVPVMTREQQQHTDGTEPQINGVTTAQAPPSLLPSNPHVPFLDNKATNQTAKVRGTNPSVPALPSDPEWHGEKSQSLFPKSIVDYDETQAADRNQAVRTRNNEIEKSEMLDKRNPRLANMFNSEGQSAEEYAAEAGFNKITDPVKWEFNNNPANLLQRGFKFDGEGNRINYHDLTGNPELTAGDTMSKVGNIVENAVVGGVIVPAVNAFSNVISGDDLLKYKKNDKVEGKPVGTLVPEVVEKTTADSAKKTTVPVVEATEASETVKEEEIKAADNGLSDKSELNPTNGKSLNGEGENFKVYDDNSQGDDDDFKKGIFDKASDFFGDLLSSSELKRLALYTLGGIMSGGSISGSFQWAGTQLLKEKQDAATTEAEKASAELLYTRQKAVKQMGIDAELTRTQLTVDGRTAAAGIVADAKVVAAGVKTETAKAAAKLVKYEKIQTYRKELPEKQRSAYKGAIAGAVSNFTRDDGTKIELGDRADGVYDKWLVHIDKLNARRGDSDFIDISDASIRSGFTIAVEQALAANRGSTGKFDLAVPEQFFDMALIRGVVSKKSGNQNIFMDSENNPIDLAANKDLVAAVNEGLKAVTSDGTKANTATVASAFWDEWNDLKPEVQKVYNDGAAEGRSGFVNFAQKYARGEKI